MPAELLQDLRQGARALYRTPSFAWAVIVTMAVAVGANTAVFSVVYGLLLKPLPYPDAARLVRLAEEHPGGQPLLQEPLLTDLTFEAWEKQAGTIELMAAYNARQYTVGRIAEPERVAGAAVSPGLFALLGERPWAGRFFDEADAVQPVAVISHRLWQRAFGSDVGVPGRTIQIDGLAHVIVAIANPRFNFPGGQTDIWTPYVAGRSSATGGGVQVLSVIGRLRRGVTLPQVEAEGTMIARGMSRPIAADLLFGSGGPVEVRARAWAEQMTAHVRPALIVLQVAVLTVMLIAALNIACLFLARGLARTPELALRAALGASRRRIARQLLVESSVMVVLGAVLGIGLAAGLMRALPGLAPSRFPRLDEVQLNAVFLTAALVLSIGCGLAAGTLPSIRAAVRAAPARALDMESPRTAARSRQRGRTALLLIETALAVLLAVAGSIAVRSFNGLTHVDPGYDAVNVLTARIFLDGPRDPARAQGITTAILDRLRSSPRVVAAGAGNMAPFGESTFISALELQSPGMAPTTARALQYVVTPGYADALRLKLREGRLLTEEDARSKRHAIVVNDSFLRAYLLDGRPVVGRPFYNLLGEFGSEAEIVGVVSDVLKDGPQTSRQPEIYSILGPGGQITREINLLVRTSGDPLAVIPDIRAIVREAAPNAALAGIVPLESTIAASIRGPRFAATILGTFAVIGLVLAMTGVYGVFSYFVSQRRVEFAVRAALGATRRQLVLLVVGRAMLVTLAGVVMGLIAAIVLAGLARNLLVGITPLDPVSFAASAVALLLVVALAVGVPAWRAGVSDPLDAMRP